MKETILNVFHIREEKKTPKEHIDQIFLNANGVMSVLTDEEDILKANAYFGAEPYHIYFTNTEKLVYGDYYLQGATEDDSDIRNGPFQYLGNELPYGYAKIVASTNKDVWIKNSDVDYLSYSDYVSNHGYDGAKIIGKEFVITYANRFNEGNPIKNILIDVDNLDEDKITITPIANRKEEFEKIVRRLRLDIREAINDNVDTSEMNVEEIHVLTALNDLTAESLKRINQKQLEDKI